MPVDHIRYDLLTQQALRGVVRSVLADSVKGLRGEHHFYITFDTQAAGVRVPARLREQYPEEMTIILQHQFWNLVVNDEAFEVGMSFGGIQERLRVPFDAIKKFIDPSVEFSIQFELKTESEEAAGATPAKSDSKARRPAKPKPMLVTADLADPPPAGSRESDQDSGQGPDKPSGGGGEVVRLDRFRKK